MLEIPESYSMAEQLNKTIKGKTIETVYANSSPHGFAFYFGDQTQYDNLLSGKVIGTAKAVGGMVEITAGDCKILFGDGVSIKYFEDNRKVPEKHQLYMEFDDMSSIVCTVQMYGGLWAFKDGTNDSIYYAVAKEKPSPLTDVFDKQYFMNLFDCTKPNLSVKALLATEQRIPGLGNGVLQDILFGAKINPKTKINQLSTVEIDILYKSVKETLLEMTAKGGRDTEKDLFGISGGYKTKLSNKTLKNPCPCCGGEIIRQAYLGGNVYYCPSCQPILK